MTAASASAGATGNTVPLLTLEIRYEQDVVLARQRARTLVQLLGYDVQDQTRIATAVSELARNAHEYAGGGQVRFFVERDAVGAAAFVARISDEGPGIRDVNAILDGRYVSKTGMGLGIVGARRLSDRFRIDSTPGSGTTVEIARNLPTGASFTTKDASRIADAMMQQVAQNPFQEVQQQNQELMRALDDVRTKQALVEQLNAELETTNRGVLALYAELDDRAHDLKRASEYKSRFLSDISHELRTPLSSVINLTRLLLDHTDGDLSREQDYQVKLIQDSVGMVMDLVNELLDLARIEAGKTVLRPITFTIGELFASLRGIMRPLVTNPAVTMVFDEDPAEIVLHTDESRLAQILRNFLSNAVKFTVAGEIRVSATRDDDDSVRIDVTDSGIGIAREHQEKIFLDFEQVDGPIQRRIRGTGLGLPLTRKLATLLGGRVEMVSEVGTGSTFSVIIPGALDLPPSDDAMSAHGNVA